MKLLVDHLNKSLYQHFSASVKTLTEKKLFTPKLSEEIEITVEFALMMNNFQCFI